MPLIHLNEDNFQKEIIESKIPVLVDFWASWCGPCKMISPIIDEISKEYAGKLKVSKVNVDDNPQIASKFGIMSIPTILFFKDGQVVDQITGAVSKKVLKNKIDEIL